MVIDFEVIELFGPMPDASPPTPVHTPAQVINDITLAALETLDDVPTCHIQEWVGESGDVLVQLTAIRIFTHVEMVWSIGRPSPGEDLIATNDTDIAALVLADLFSSEEGTPHE